MSPILIGSDAEASLAWSEVVERLADGHRLPIAAIKDVLITRGDNSILSRSAWIEGLGIGVKTATIFPGNGKLTPPFPNINAVVTLFDDVTGVPTAVIDGTLVTKWKTAGDSALGARLLARVDSRQLLIVGAGVIARATIEAYSAIFPDLSEIQVWNRNYSNAVRLAEGFHDKSISVRAVEDLPTAVMNADIICASTMTKTPIIRGEWVKPGTHVDLIGAFRPDMREVDDDLLLKSTIYVDSRATTIHEIGELLIPIKAGVISEDDVKGDLYNLCRGSSGRLDQSEITIFKNGGGAHLDLMTASYILEKNVMAGCT